MGAGGRYDGLLRRAWGEAGVTGPPMLGVGLTLNVERLVSLASRGRPRPPDRSLRLSQVRPPNSSASQTRLRDVAGARAWAGPVLRSTCADSLHWPRRGRVGPVLRSTCADSLHLAPARKGGIGLVNLHHV